MNDNCNHKWVLVSDVVNEIVPDDDGSVTEVSLGVYKCALCKKDTYIKLEPDYDLSLKDYLKDKCDNDEILIDMIYDYFTNKSKLGENNSKIVIEELYKNKPVFEEFIKFLTIDSYLYDNPITIHGYTAKSIREANPNMSDLEVFESLNFLYVRNQNK